MAGEDGLGNAATTTSTTTTTAFDDERNPLEVSDFDYLGVKSDGVENGRLTDRWVLHCEWLDLPLKWDAAKSNFVNGNFPADGRIIGVKVSAKTRARISTSTGRILFYTNPDNTEAEVRESGLKIASIMRPDIEMYFVEAADDLDVRSGRMLHPDLEPTSIEDTYFLHHKTQEMYNKYRVKKRVIEVKYKPIAAFDHDPEDEVKEENVLIDAEVGKWMLFYRNGLIDQKWKLAVRLYEQVTFGCNQAIARGLGARSPYFSESTISRPPDPCEVKFYYSKVSI